MEAMILMLVSMKREVKIQWIDHTRSQLQMIGTVQSNSSRLETLRLNISFRP